MLTQQYGHPLAGEGWRLDLREKMGSVEAIALDGDDGVKTVYVIRDGEGEVLLVINVYVDDLYAVSNDPQRSRVLRDLLRDEYGVPEFVFQLGNWDADEKDCRLGQVELHGETGWDRLVGADYKLNLFPATQDWPQELRIKISQSLYKIGALKKFESYKELGKLSDQPTIPGLTVDMVVDSDDDPTPDPAVSHSAAPTLLGVLMYCSTHACPDLLRSVLYLARRKGADKWGKQEHKLFRRLFQYTKYFMHRDATVFSVHKGEKWAANLWVWNGPRLGQAIHQHMRAEGGGYVYKAAPQAQKRRPQLRSLPRRSRLQPSPQPPNPFLEYNYN